MMFLIQPPAARACNRKAVASGRNSRAASNVHRAARCPFLGRVFRERQGFTLNGRALFAGWIDASALASGQSIVCFLHDEIELGIWNSPIRGLRS
jgi:hypothetical protein